MAYIRDTSIISLPSLDSVHVVHEFMEVFLTDLPSMPSNRDIGFIIDVESGIKPISIPPNRMAPAELKELKDQL